MNFFKRFGSFASSSWKDFSENYDQQPLEESEITDGKAPKEGSFELRKRCEEDVAAKKAAHGFFRKRFSKKKLLLVDDPRSPTVDFERTPIQVAEPDASGILSPFNVHDMLATVDSVVNTPTKSVENALTDFEAANEDQNLLDDADFTGNVGNWNDFKFNEKLMTESLIVEVSTLDINAGDISSSTFAENDASVANDSSSEVKQRLLPEESEEEGVAKNCKIVGCIVKSDEQIKTDEDTEPATPNDEPLIVTSTPKKAAAISKLADETKKAPRTPLSVICNSPLVKNNKLANSQGKKQNTEKNRKKKVTTACSRQLPKAPATPLTPLFKTSKQSHISHFDKENY